MTTMWNSSATAGDISVTINFQGGTGHYSNPIHLEPFASFNLDIALLIANKMPDKDGKAIPLVISEGSIIFANAKGRTLPISLNVSLGIFNAATATSDFYCLDCDGYIRAEVTSSQLDLLLSTSYAMTANGVYSDGGYYEVPYPNWYVTDSAVLSFDSASQTVTATGPGSAGVDIEPVLPCGGQYCGYSPYCNVLREDTNFIGTSRIDVLVPTYLTVSVGEHISHNGDDVTAPDGQIVLQSPCYGYSRSYTYEIWPTARNRSQSLERLQQKVIVHQTLTHQG